MKSTQITAVSPHKIDDTFTEKLASEFNEIETRDTFF